jgi:hypothetical protein
VSGAETERPPLGRELSLGLGIATLGAVLVVVPATLRVSGSASAAMAFLGLLGGAALTIGPAAAALRLARPFGRLAWSVPLGLCVSLAPLIVLARILILGTHHRPLGGATFAFVATGLLAGAVAVSARLLAWSAKREGALRKAPLALGAGMLALGALLSLPALGGPLRASLLDGALGALLVIGGAALRPPDKLAKGLARAGVLVWVAAVALGLAVGLASPEVRSVLDSRAPVLLGLAGWLRS